MEAVLQRYHDIQEEIYQAAQSVGRSPSEVRLVVVTKGHPIEKIEPLIAGGVREFGENRVEDALPKIEAFGDKPDIRWHMIGHVQSRKARFAAGNFDLVHSIDRGKLAARLNDSCSELGIVQQILLQFNVSGEQTKFGWGASDPSLWDSLLPEVEAVLKCDYLKVRGLMTLAPYNPDPEVSRPFFGRLRKLRDYLASRFPGQDWGQLSMGMSDDFRVAVQEGATIVRVGTAILGPRG